MSAGARTIADYYSIDPLCLFRAFVAAFADAPLFVILDPTQVPGSSFGANHRISFNLEHVSNLLDYGAPILTGR
jgi:hypothetical protein